MNIRIYIQNYDKRTNFGSFCYHNFQGQRGPVLLQDVNFIDEMSHFDRERIPERVVHAKGAGAFGYFEVTHDISKYTSAKLFDKVGKRTVSFSKKNLFHKFVLQFQFVLACGCSIFYGW